MSSSWQMAPRALATSLGSKSFLGLGFTLCMDEGLGVREGARCRAPFMGIAECGVARQIEA